MAADRKYVVLMDGIDRNRYQVLINELARSANLLRDCENEIDPTLDDNSARVAAIAGYQAERIHEVIMGVMGDDDVKVFRDEEDDTDGR